MISIQAMLAYRVHIQMQQEHKVVQWSKFAMFVLLVKSQLQIHLINHCVWQDQDCVE